VGGLITVREKPCQFYYRLLTSLNEKQKFDHGMIFSKSIIYSVVEFFT
jgi:hypothetical protein